MQIKFLIHSALYFEAQSFIIKYKLKRDMEINDFMFFYNPKNQMGLITSTKSRASVAYAFGYIKAKYKIYRDCKILNFGICGADNIAIGSLREVVKITDNITNENYYPIYIDEPYFETANLTSFASPNTDYEVIGLYDMEAACFFESASRLVLCENIRIIKIISDNSNNSLENFDHKVLTNHIEVIANELFSCIEKILLNQEEIDDILESRIEHFSFSEQRILRSLVRSISALRADFNVKEEVWKDFDFVKNKLEKQLAQCEIKY